MGVHSFTFSYTFGNMKCDSWASFLARTFASPCLGHKPKVRVVTWKLNLTIDLQSFQTLLPSHILFKCYLHSFIGKLTIRRACLPNFKLYTQIKKKLCYMFGEFFLRFQTPKLPLLTSIISKVLSSNLFSLFPPSIKINHSYPFKESCKNKFSKIQIWKYVRKERAKLSKFVP